MKKLALSALLPLSLLAACETAGGLDFDFAATPLPQAPNPVLADSVANIAGGLVYVTRYTTTPCLSDGLTAGGRRNGSQLTLTVERIASNPCPNDQDRTFRYRAVFGNLRSGTYQVRVVEEINGAPVTVKDTSVVVR
jgi:hypothetical protein